MPSVINLTSQWIQCRFLQELSILWTGIYTLCLCNLKSLVSIHLPSPISIPFSWMQCDCTHILPKKKTLHTPLNHRLRDTTYSSTSHLWLLCKKFPVSDERCPLKLRKQWCHTGVLVCNLGKRNRCRCCLKELRFGVDSFCSQPDEWVNLTELKI